MIVEIWSDIACPFCYIGKRRYEQALSQLPFGKEVKTVYRSFVLDPDAPIDPPYDVHDMLASKYGMSREQALKMNEQVAEQAQTVGLDYDMDRIIPTKTFDAHRMIHFAAQSGKMAEMKEKLLKAYFTDGKHVAKAEVLADLAAEIGLDREEALAVLSSDRYSEEVRADLEEAAKLGIRGVPFFVIDRKYAVSGAQTLDVFIQALDKAKSEQEPLITMNNEDNEAGASCTDGSCSTDQK